MPFVKVYYRDATSAFVVIDVTRPHLEVAAKWKNDIDSKVHLQDGTPIPTILIANKVCYLISLQELSIVN